MKNTTSNIKRVFTKSRIATAIVMTLCTNVSFAAETAADTAEAENAASGIETITVTARKRVESIQDIPIAITVISDAIVDDGNLDTIADFMEMVPNVAMPQDGYTSSDISIRGSGRIRRDEDPGVGLNRDGVYIGGLLTSFSNFYDMERIEILRGPQSGLYGRNAVGGAVNITSTKPEFYQDGYLDVQFGNLGHQEYRAAANVTLVEDVLAIRVSGLYLDQSEGFNYAENQDLYLDAFENKSARLRVLYTPTDDLEFLTTVETFSSNGNILQPVFGPESEYSSLNPFLPPYPGTDSDDTEHLNYDFRPSNESEQVQFIQEINWDLGHGTITGIYSYRDTEMFLESDTDNTIIDLQSLTSDAEQQSNFFEIRYNGQFGKFNVTTGITYIDEDLQLNNTYQFGGMIGLNLESWYTNGVTDESAAIYGLPVGVPIAAFGLTGDLGNGGGFTGALGDAFPAHYINEQTLKSTAVFLETNYAVNDDLDIWFSVRYTEDEKTIVFDQSTGACDVACPEAFNLLFGSDLLFDLEASETWSEVSPSFGVNYDVSDDLMLYAKYSTGFKAGGFNSIASSVDIVSFDPETTKSYEIGMKSIWWDNQFLVNVSAFQQTRFDSLVEVQDPGMSINDIGVNAGEIDAKGLELSFIMIPLEGLDINLSLGYLDSEFEEFVINGEDFGGNRTPDNFKYSISGVISYTTPLTDETELFTYASYYSSKDAYYVPANTSKKDEPEIVDFRIGVKAVEWKISLFIDNVLDNRYIAYGSDPRDLDSPHQGLFAPGRTYGIQMAYYFE